MRGLFPFFIWEESMKGKLKQCPFCGFPRPKVVLLQPDGMSRYTNKFMVLCDYRDGGCGASSGWFNCPEEAGYMWNQRRRKWRDD